MEETPDVAYVATKWGRIKVTCPTLDVLAFSTGYKEEHEGEGKQRLTINRKGYYVDWSLTNAPATEGGHNVYKGGWRTVDRQWSGLRLDPWGGYDGRPTDAAQDVWTEQIVPLLVEFANSDEADELLRQGADTFHAQRWMGALATLAALSEAINVLAPIMRKIKRRETLTDAERDFASSAHYVRRLVESGRW